MRTAEEIPAALPAALARPEPYPHRPTSVEVRETHISWVFLAGEYAYKLKKPLRLDFVDYSTAERRRQMCAEEVRLNRRLAPDIYLGVRGVARADGGFELTEESDPRAVDYVVEMRRFDESYTLAAQLDSGSLEPNAMEAIGRRIAEFHRRVPVAEANAPVIRAERRFERNLHDLLQWLDGPGEMGRVLALERFAHAFISASAPTLRARASAGLVRDGHGDLRAEHVLLAPTLQIVDCVEFDPGLRALDVADDLSFLVFDLVARGAERLAASLVAAYRQAGGDAGDDSLIAFYACYRALVRAKVALIRAGQLADAGEQPRGREEGWSLIEVAERFAWRARLPLVIVVCGVPASGKSSLAQAVANQSGLAYLSSDVVRKELARIAPTDRAPHTVYSPRWNARTYAELGRRAARAVARDRGAIVDATFRCRADRDSFSAAFESRAPLLFVECKAPLSVLSARGSAREHGQPLVSDAGLGVVLREHAAWEPLDELPANAHLLLRTDRRLQQTLGDLLALLDRRLEAAAQAT
ncbi:MAG: bifunctional aminoglycoside phosphotransferase/ATP-binding protein [Solirubrobacteraceae bacterium]